MSFEIVRENPYFINADGEKKTHIVMGAVMSFAGTFTSEDGMQFGYKFGYDFNSDEYIGIDIVNENEVNDFEELFIVRLSCSNSEISLDSLEQRIVQECFSGEGRFIISKISEKYDCFFV